MLKCPKQCLKLHGSIFVIFFDSVLVAAEILRKFVIILTPDDKYSLSVKVNV